MGDSSMGGLHNVVMAATLRLHDQAGPQEEDLGIEGCQHIDLVGNASAGRVAEIAQP